MKYFPKITIVLITTMVPTPPCMLFLTTPTRGW